MKLQILSDLHLEHHADYGASLVDSPDFSNADLIVLAGDIVCCASKTNQHSKMIKRICDKAFPKTVLYLPGNHEYYGTSPSIVADWLLAANTLPNIHILGVDNPLYPEDVLDNSLLAGVRILGDTLWFKDDPMNVVYAGGLADFQVIKDFTPWVYRRHDACVDALEANLTSKDVVVTHHLPSPACIPAQYRTSNLNRFFAADLTDLILERKPKLWVCGHTHNSIDMVLGETRIICNPFGYPHELNRSFNPGLIVEVFGD